MENKEKISYEQLNDYCNQLMMQNRQLSQRLNQVMNIHTKLPFLFEVLKLSHMFSEQFVTDTVKEVEDSLNSMKNVASTEASIEDAEVNA